MRLSLPLRLPSTLAVILTAAPAAAQFPHLDGYWTTGDPTACVVGMDDANVAIQIAGTRFEGLESHCNLTNPVPIRDMPEAVLFDRLCHGEGMQWQSRVLFALTHDGTLLELFDGFAQSRLRCTNLR